MAFHPARRPARLADVTPVTDDAAREQASVAGVDGVPTDQHAVPVRSALSVAPSLRLRVDDTAVDLHGSHAVLSDGTVVLAVDPMTPTGGLLVAVRGRPGAVRLDVTHLVPVAVRSRVRARVTMRGTLRRFDPASLDSCDGDTVMSLLDLPPVALWAFEPVEIAVTRGADEATVGIRCYRAARPDPFAADEAAHLHHLSRQHGAVLARLASPADPARATRPARVVPVAVDADGLVLRAETPDGHTDVRLPFTRRVTTDSGLAEELRAMLAGATRH